MTNGLDQQEVTSGNTISQRVFCIGMNKTGTSTLKHCFKALNLGPVASPHAYDQDTRGQIKYFYDHKNYEAMLDLAENYKSFEDRPWNMWTMYRHLHERFPDSYFILTVRDPESWWRSTERWVTVTKPAILPRYQQHLRVHEPNQENMTESYLRYNDEVQAYFKGTGKLLLMDIEAGDGWEKICGFLGLPVPEEPFPHVNQQSYTAEQAEELRDKKHLKNGVVCQSCYSITRVKRPGKVRRKKKSELNNKVKKQAHKKQWRRFLRELASGNVSCGILNSGANYLKDSPRTRALFYKLNTSLLAAHASSTLLINGEPPVFNGELPEGELAVVSCFFNPGGSRKRIANFKAFLAGIKESGVPCLVVELAFGEKEFCIEHDNVIRVRASNVLWHKERLLNIGIKELLAQGYRKIAWLDGDIVFDSPNWPVEIANRLEHANLCQVFETIGVATHENGAPMVADSSMKYFHRHGELFQQPIHRGVGLLIGQFMGGQSGFGWAARAEVLQQVPLYENAIVGGGDKLIYISALAGDFSQEQFKAMTESKVACKRCGHRNRSEAYRENFEDWARRWSDAVDGKVDYARLHIRDMFHGARSDRGYLTRHDILYRNEYDPAVDLVDEEAECYTWAEGKEELKREVEAYFLARREDV